MRYTEDQVRALLADERVAQYEYERRHYGDDKIPTARARRDAAEVEVAVMRIMVAQQAGGAG